MAFSFAPTTASPSPSPSLFGAASSPAQTTSLGGFGFGATPAQQPAQTTSLGGFGFGATPAQQPAQTPSLGGFGFGATPMPTQQPAPGALGGGTLGGGALGAATATASAFGGGSAAAAAPLTHATRWEEMPAQAREKLGQLEYVLLLLDMFLSACRFDPRRTRGRRPTYKNIKKYKEQFI